MFLSASRRLRAIPAATCGVLALLSPAIAAAKGGGGGSPCTAAAGSQVFLPWADPAYYNLVSGGTFESAKNGWKLSGGAARVTGSEPFAVTGTLGSWSLSLPAGASAVSPAACAAANYPTVRFFVAGTGSVGVDFQYGSTVIPSGTVISAGSSWAPGPIVVTGSAISLVNGSQTVNIKLVGISGDPQIDDVYIDPWNRG